MTDRSHEYSIQDQIADLKMGRPHLVILGAGASIAATPNGDRTGRRLPSMANFIEVLNLGGVLAYAGINGAEAENFEALYSRLVSEGGKEELVQTIENAVHEYFSGMLLPETVTVYDKLVLSLRGKDAIATFNWDPFLYQACFRNRHVGDLPHVMYLHGGVATAYCFEHKTMGLPNMRCSVCQKPFEPSPLLFPVAEKEYTKSPFISAQWKALRHYLGGAYVITMFGYGAPKSDAAAVALMEEAWGDTANRELEQSEIIDIRDEDDLRDLWDGFIHSHHYEVHRTIDESWICRHPRRSCETVWAQFMDVKFVTEHRPPATTDLSELQAWYGPLVAAEKKVGPKT